MESFRLRNGRVVSGQVVTRKDIVVSGGRLVGDVPAGCVDVDLDGLVVSPGFVDLQINGGFGMDLTDAPSTVGALSALLPRVGVTAFTPTLVSPSFEVLGEALGRRPPSQPGAARSLGWHIEGPAIAPSSRGTHPVSRLTSATEFGSWGLSSARGVAMVTLAPELAGCLQLVRQLVDAGVKVSLGHSAADSNSARQAIDAGANFVTHLFNAMLPFHHREPGLAGVALVDERVCCGVIVDGAHLSSNAVIVAWRCLGPRRLVLVSDAMAAAGLGAGDHRIAGVDVSVVDETVRNVDGRLAGSASFIDAALRRFLATVGCGLPEAVAVVTSNPRRVIGAGGGQLSLGETADLVLLDDDLRVRATLVAGVVAHDPHGIFGEAFVAGSQ